MNASWKRGALILVLGALGLLLLSTDQGAGTQVRSPVRLGEPENEVENLTRGPLHEAYATPLSVEARPTESLRECWLPRQ